jgi:hypothetical protein
MIKGLKEASLLKPLILILKDLILHQQQLSDLL